MIHPTIDHMMLAQRHPIEVQRMRSLMILLWCGPPQLLEFAVEHEADNSCCRLESWSQTMESVLAEVTSGAEPHSR